MQSWRASRDVTVMWQCFKRQVPFHVINAISHDKCHFKLLCPLQSIWHLRKMTCGTISDSRNMDPAFFCLKSNFHNYPGMGKPLTPTSPSLHYFAPGPKGLKGSLIHMTFFEWFATCTAPDSAQTTYCKNWLSVLVIFVSSGLKCT